ncbi:MAG: DNA-formamidopyrimidine glycosylase family protein [Gordonia sp. (in: high G+C Gram-positive bacteria)]
MPEGDTVFAAAHRLHRALGGKTLVRTDFRVPKWATTDLSGWTVDEVRAVGKHLFVVVTSPDRGATAAIHSHLMMDGVWHVYAPGDKWRKPGFKARLVLEAGPSGAARDVQAVGFELGICELVDSPENSVAHLGPDLLGPGWDRDVAASNLAAVPDRPIGLALLDQRVLAGVGNIYRSEICFLQGIHPASPVRESDAAAVVDCAHRLLTANRLRTVRATTGDPRRGRELWVYGRERRPCRRCGTPIRKESLAGPADAEAVGRTVYFCPSCQPAPH